jgi:hypothetical protein
MRIGIANEFRRQRVEKRPGRRSLNMLVHGDLPVLPRLKCLCLERPGCDEPGATRYTIVLSCILT